LATTGGAAIGDMLLGAGVKPDWITLVSCRAATANAAHTIALASRTGAKVVAPTVKIRCLDWKMVWETSKMEITGMWYDFRTAVPLSDYVRKIGTDAWQIFVP